MPLNQNLKKDSKVLWTISIIQDQTPTAQTKAEFAEMANDVINNENIQDITICLADNLQRFRLMIQHGISEEEAIKMCGQLALNWHYENKEADILIAKSKNISWLNWQDFLNWPDKDKTIADIEKLYEGKPEFKVDVDTRIRQVRDSLKNPKISDTLEQTSLLRKYLFEELAFQKFCASKGFKYEIYKTQCCKAMRRIKNNTDFVPTGLMREIFFTQFDQKNSAVKNNIQPIHRERESTEKASFQPVFSNTVKQTEANALKNNSVDINSREKKIAEFIEKTLTIIPTNLQEKAIQALLKFTTEEIIPLCYVEPINTMKI